MGHYCNECGEKLSGGVTPTCCTKIECYCEGCWRRLTSNDKFSDGLVYNIKKEINKNGKLSNETKELILNPPKNVCCECNTEIIYGDHVSYCEKIGFKAIQRMLTNKTVDEDEIIHLFTWNVTLDDVKKLKFDKTEKIEKFIKEKYGEINYEEESTDYDYEEESTDYDSEVELFKVLQLIVEYK
jgi:hypothetical protein